MKYTNALLFLLAAALFLGACGQIRDPEFRRLESFRVKKAGLQQTDLGFAVTYFNPNRFGVSVKETEADFYIDSVFIGKFVQEHPVEVGKNAEFSIPFTGSIALMTLLQLNIQDLNHRKVDIKANGSVKIGKAGVYISRPFIYQGKHQVDIRL
jgi:LEA14-like dessication related protein